MRWLLRRLESLTAALAAACGGIAAAQLPAFVQQYLQRLGGHLAEAERALRAAVENSAGLTEAARDQLAALAAARVDALAEAHDAVARGDDIVRPLAFLRHADWDIARAAWGDFTPALQADIAGAVYGFAGMLLAWLVWELIKAPLKLLLVGGLPSAIRKSGRS